jgi:nitrogen regulatory protein PII 2
VENPDFKARFSGDNPVKKITAKIRTNKVQKTKDALFKCGIPSFTVRGVIGHRKRKGLRFEFDPPLQGPKQKEAGNYIRFVPKRIFNIVVDEASVNEVVQKIIEVNHIEEWKVRDLKPDFRRTIP